METDIDVIREFVIESGENLGRLDREMVELEQRPGDAKLLASVFRTIHTIKGTCGFFGYRTIGRVTHHAENILSQIRNGERQLTPQLVSLILETVDAVKAELTSIEATSIESGAAYADLLERQEAAASQAGSSRPRRWAMILAKERTCCWRRSRWAHPAVAFFRISASSSVRWSGWVSRALLIVRGLGTAGAARVGVAAAGPGEPEGPQVAAHGLGAAFEPEGPQLGGDGLGAGHALVPALVDQVDEGVEPGGAVLGLAEEFLCAGGVREPAHRLDVEVQLP